MFARTASRRLPTNALACSIAAILGTGGVTAVYGQEQESGQDQNRNEETIVVTGSRIRRDDYSATNATVVVTAEDMNDLGITSAAEMIAQLPSNVGTHTPETGTDNNYFLGASIANLRGLNTYFGTRTLTLVDSRRFPATNNGGGVDLNLVPNALIGRVETVTGGASATYGADALAGVVNVILDRDIEDRRINLSYKTTSEGDGDNIDFSFGTGFDLLDGRGSVQIGIDHTFQKAIHDCTTREFCRRSIGTMTNGTGPQATHPYRERTAGVSDPGLPAIVIADGMRYTTPTTGLAFQQGGLFGIGLVPPFYTFNEAGNDIIEIYSADSEQCGPALTPTQLAWLADEGGTNGQGGGGDTPWGCGRLTYAGVPLIPETTRDNLYARFAYELEGGIEIDAEISYGKSHSVALQNSSRRSYDIAGVEIFGERMTDIPGVTTPGGTLMSGNAFIQPGIASPAMVDLFDDMLALDNNGAFSCGFFIAPFGPTPNLASQATCAYFYKDFSAQTQQRNDTETDVKRVTLGANGDLFDAGSWTWDAYITLGRTDTSQQIANWQALIRRNMAYDGILDQSNQPVCRINYSDDGSPAYGVNDPNYDPADQGDVIREIWLRYFENRLERDRTNPVDAAEVELYLTSLAQGCSPINQMGYAMSPEATAYAYPTIREGSEISQDAVSLSFSGDLWQGFDAGPLRMAAGIDWNESDTTNLPPDDPILARDFYVNYGDVWGGISTNTEAFVEFELPLLSGVTGADNLVINVSDRRVKNESERTTGTPQTTTRYVSSWKASLVWQPMNLMNVRMTRSADTRAPSSRELFESSTPATAAVQSTNFDNPFNPVDGNDDVAQFSRFGGNVSLGNEVSTTQTLGIVFAPVEALSGLRASIDYIETRVRGGIESVSYTQVPARCVAQMEIGLAPEDQSYCLQMTFGEPDPSVDPDDPYFSANFPGNEALAYAYSNVEFINSSQENSQPITSRSIDYSVSYFTQLAGGGSLSGRVLATRYLEQRRERTPGTTDPLLGTNVVGQTGSNGGISAFPGEGGGFGINYSPVPKLSSNLWLTYEKNAFSFTSQIRYLGSGRLNIGDGWIGPGDAGFFFGAPAAPADPYCTGAGGRVACPYDARLENTVASSRLPSWTTLTLNLRYDFGRSAWAPENFNSLAAYINITNVGDRVPDFYSGYGAGGVNSTFFSGMGRQLELGVQMSF